MQDFNGDSDPEALHRDLVALTQGQLRNVDRLWDELRAQINAFQELLQELRKNDASRRKVLSGELTIDDETFSLNKEFQECTIQLADLLDLDEVKSVGLLLLVQSEADLTQQSITISAAIIYQQRRQFLFECLRLVLVTAVDSEVANSDRASCQDIVGLIVGGGGAAAPDGPTFVFQCSKTMVALEERLHNVMQRMQAVTALGQSTNQERDDLLLFEQQSLTSQHESLSGIISLLVKASYSDAKNFEMVLDRMSKLDRWSCLAIHYCPIILSFIAQHGSPDGVGSLGEARILHKKIMNRADASMWILRYLQAAVQTWWLAEYSGWYSNQYSNSPLPELDLEREAIQRSEAFFSALKEGAFQCTLTMCSQITQSGVYDPAKSSLVSFLLRDAPLPQPDRLQASTWFQNLVAEQLESFVDSLITNMPDTLRQFKSEEDEQRKRIYSKLQKSDTEMSVGQDMHLERFLVIAAFSYDQRSEAANCFWGDSDSNLYGFLQWASRRQSTPSVSAFCELLRAISQTEEYATSAHHFLLDEDMGTQAKLKKRGSLSWLQILEELSTFTVRARDGSNVRNSRKMYEHQPDADDIIEPESVLMLENYLRLMAHLCTESVLAREWALSLSNPNILELLCAFCTNAVPGRLQACALMAIRSMLTAKTPEVSFNVWSSLDLWAFGITSPSNVPRPQKIADPSTWFEEITSNNVLASFDQLEQFTQLVSALLRPFKAEDLTKDVLPFPENLGSSYRMVGVRPYIDLIMKAISTGRAIYTDDSLKTHLLSDSVLQLITECLSSFDEHKIILAGKHSLGGQAGLSTDSISAYLKLHPFAQVMGWLSDERVLSWLFTTSHVDAEDILVLNPNSVQMQCIRNSVEVMNLFFDHQTTYANGVRPLLKNHLVGDFASATASSFTSFEEKVLQHSQLVLDLGLYAGLGDPRLAHGSLALLGKLASSRKLQGKFSSSRKPLYPISPLINIFQRDDNVESITQPLAKAMEIGEQDIQPGNFANEFALQSSILEFLLEILLSVPQKPSLAHTLLGLRCGGTNMEVSPTGLFARGASLFHAIARFAIACPDGTDDHVDLSAIRLRRMATQVLFILWSSPLTSAYILPELQQSGLLFGLMTRQQVLDASLTTESHDTLHPEFLISESVETLQEALRLRSYLFEYASTEIRFIISEGVAASRDRILATLHGLGTTIDGQTFPCPGIFELSDFLDLQIPAALVFPQLTVLTGFNCDMLLDGGTASSGPLYQFHLVESLLDIRVQGMRRSGQLQDSNIEEQRMAESAQIISYAYGQNNHQKLSTASEDALKSWCNLMALIAEASQSNVNSLRSFVSQAEQALSPKLEILAFEHDCRAIHIARLLKFLSFTFGLDEASGSDAAANGMVTDREYQVFRAALRSSAAPEVEYSLREVLNQICYSFLVKSVLPSASQFKAQQILHALKASGTRHIRALCDDVLTAEESGRITALLLLDAYCMVAAVTGSPSMIETLVDSNFLQVMVEAIEQIPLELQETDAQDIPSLLVFYGTKLSLLLTIAQSRAGASQLVKAGLFRAVSKSGLFAVDPDIGIEMDNPAALAKYYTLLVSISRIVVSTLISHGVQNNGMVDMGRQFVAENRALIVSTFKRKAKIGGVSFDDGGIDIDELVELFTMLIDFTEFLEQKDESLSPQRRRAVFT